MGFHIHVDISDVANKLNTTAELIQNEVKQAMGEISLETHHFILETVRAELNGFKERSYLGENDQNVRWAKVGDGMWVVEVSPKAQWLEEGRPRMFMDWLLKNAKTAKDGSKYKAIPMAQDKGAGKEPGWHPHRPALAEMTKKALKSNKISLDEIERDYSHLSFKKSNRPLDLSKQGKREPIGRPKTGVLHNIPTGRYELEAELSPNRSEYFSKPRSWEDSQNTGLPMHQGIFLLEGLMVTQRPNAKAKYGVTREAITYRVISSKHEQEGRWFYPEVKALNAVPRAYENAKKKFDEWLRDFSRRFEDNQR